MKTTTIVNYSKTDRVVKIIIDGNEYLLFTINKKTFIVIDMTDKSKPILLCNKTCNSCELLNEEFDKIILMATRVVSSDEFVYNMDTYIDLFTNSIKNDTSEEIFAMYHILLENYKLYF